MSNISKLLKCGEIAYWRWGKYKLSGKVKEVYHHPVSKVIKGTEIHRNASQENPAYFIQRENKNTVLKLHSELIH